MQEKEELTSEEREIVDFFKGLAPILDDAFRDLERRGLLDEEFFKT